MNEAKSRAGKKGGAARARKLTAKQRSAISKKGSQARERNRKQAIRDDECERIAQWADIFPAEMCSRAWFASNLRRHAHRIGARR
jgi:hypothetical protein